MSGFRCDMCGLVCKSQGGLTQHQNRTHSGDMGTGISGSSTTGRICRCGIWVPSEEHLISHFRHCPLSAYPWKKDPRDVPASEPQAKRARQQSASQEDMLVDDDGGSKEILEEDVDARLVREFCNQKGKEGRERWGLRPSSSGDKNWAFDEGLSDIIGLLDWSLRFEVSNSGVEELIRLFKGMSTDRIRALPRSWKTLSKRAMEGHNPASYEEHEYDVPEELELPFAKVPFVLKKTDTFIQELLTDVDLARPESFSFGGDPAITGKNAKLLTLLRSLGCLIATTERAQYYEKLSTIHELG